MARVEQEFTVDELAEAERRAHRLQAAQTGAASPAKGHHGAPW